MNKPERTAADATVCYFAEYKTPTDHKLAYISPRKGHESAIVHNLRAWIEYADAHADVYDAPVGADYLLGATWAQWADNIVDLLSGEVGRLDREAIHGLIRCVAKSQEVEVE